MAFCRNSGSLLLRMRRIKFFLKEAEMMDLCQQTRFYVYIKVFRSGSGSLCGTRMEGV